MTDPTTTTRSAAILPSPLFLALIAAAGFSGWALWNTLADVGILTFVFVATAWVISLCLHEFAHALVAYRNGDESVRYRGYLTLDPLKYTHPVFSIVLPLVFVLLGGIGLPGGAVFINQAALRTRGARSRVSAAGPATNLIIAILLGAAFALREGPSPFWAAVAFLIFLQVTAVVLNLLPVPGLDGFGIIEPWLPTAWLARTARVAPFAILILFGLLWIPAINAWFFQGIFGILTALGVPGVLVGSGYGQFRFWG